MALVTSVAATVGVGTAMRVFGGPTTTAAAAPRSTSPTQTGAPAGASAGAPAGGAAPSNGYADGTYTGTAVYNGWGNVQVRVTVASGKVATVTEIQEPNDRRSYSINSYAQPILESEAVAAQSSNIDIVSGATYTSQAYASSLQAALDKAAPTATDGSK
jgi:uncharacterized protein with FMN-binding domain